MLILFFAIGFSIVCYLIATERKNRNGTKWAILGFFFGIIAFAWLLILHPVPEEQIDS